MKNKSNVNNKSMSMKKNNLNKHLEKLKTLIDSISELESVSESKKIKDINKVIDSLEKELNKTSIDSKERETGEKRYQSFVENSNEGIYLIEYKKPININLPMDEQVELILKQGIITECNDAMLKMYGFDSKEELIGKSLFELYGSNIIEENYQTTKSFIESGYYIKDAQTIEYDINKNVKYFLNNARGIIKDGNLIGNWGIQRDITEQKKTEEKIRKSNKLLESVLNHSQDGIIGLDVNGYHTFINSAGQILLGFSEEELIGIKSYDTWHYKHNDGSLYDEKECPIYISLSKGTEHRGEEIFVRKDGSTFWAEITCSPILEENKSVGAVITFRDISERKSIEEKLKLSDRIFNHAMDMLCIAGFDGYFKVLNPAWEKTLGWSTEELLSKPWLEFVHPDDKESTTEIKEVLVDGKPAYQFTNRYVTKDGSTKWLSWNSFPYPEENIMFGVARDITLSRQNEQQLNNFFEQPLNLNLIADFEGKIKKVNKSWEVLLGYGKDELIGKSFFDLIHPDDIQQTIDEMEKLGKGLITFHFENRYKHKKGEFKTLAWSSVSSLEEKLVYAVAVDITEKKIAEEALTESEKQFKDLFNKAADAIFITEAESGLILDANEAATRLMKLPKEKIIGLHQSNLHPKEKEENAVDTFKQQTEKTKITNTPLPLENLILSSDGSIVNVEILASHIYYKGRECLMGTFRDITERKNAESVLKESEEKFRSLVLSLDDIVYTLDTDQRHTGVFGEWVNKLGLTPGYFIGKKASEIFGSESASIHEECNNRALKGDNVVYEWFIETGNDKKYYQTSISPMYNSEGSIKGIVGVARDISKLKQSENEIKIALKEKEVLLKEVHHRVKNNFQLINNMLSLESDIIDDEKVLKIFGDVQNRIRSLSLAHEILYTSSNFAEISFNRYVKSLTEYLQRSFFKSTQSIEVIIDIDDVEFEPDIVIPCGIIINELVTNAAKYAFLPNTNGIITVSLKKNEDKHILTISDNGVGLPDNFNIEKTDSFGLYLVKALSQQIEGELEVSSSKKGSSFIIKF